MLCQGTESVLGNASVIKFGQLGGRRSGALPPLQCIRHAGSSWPSRDPQENVKNQATAPDHCCSPITRPSGAQQEEPPPRLPALPCWPVGSPLLLQSDSTKSLRWTGTHDRFASPGWPGSPARWMGSQDWFVGQVRRMGIFRQHRPARSDDEGWVRWTGIPRPTSQTRHRA